MLVTGASRGLGRAIAEGFAAEGARLVVTATDGRHLDAVLAAVRGRGAEAHGVGLDLADGASCAAAGAEALGALGRLDVLVNNASLLGERADLADADMDVFDRVMAVNVGGTLRLTQAVLSGMADGGAIVNVTSGAAARATWGAYAVSKHALDGATVMLRDELAPRGIRCVAVNPGGLRTAMRAAAYPGEDPATLPRPESVVPVFVAIAEGADPGPHVNAKDWTPA
ncbi:MAG TPA: SDR family NAD(P)-dependent oxidoreductase [Miltoncostaea sp.]|nr:SDR family NAD(P)-dependent oxidoreductase [Miltoncostaea sp.]